MKFYDRRSLRRTLVILGVVVALIIIPPLVFFAHQAYQDRAGAYAQPVGQLHMESIRSYGMAAAKYEEKRTGQGPCHVNMIGYDAKYVYGLIGCSGYEFEGRFTYAQNPLVVTDATYVGDDDENPSRQSLFPKPVAKEDWKMLSTGGY